MTWLSLVLWRLQARTFFRLDGSRSSRIWEVLCAAGWLRDNRPEEAEDKRKGPRAKKDAALAKQLDIKAAAAASLAVGFPPAAPGGVIKAVSAAAAVAAAAAALGLPLPAGAAESVGEGLTSEATGATNSGAVAADNDDDDDDFRP
jgi:hypothetical protein